MTLTARARSWKRWAAAALAGGLGGEAAAGEWGHLAGTPERASACVGPLPALESPAWIAAVDDAGQAVKFVGQAGVVCDLDRVYAAGWVGGEAHLLAFWRSDGSCAWSAPSPEPHGSSWATAAVDGGNGAVLLGAGESLTAFDAKTGEVRWQTTLNRPVVNASALVTADRGAADRAFITDFDGFGDSARLYCVNVDPFDALTNPFDPGEVVWSAGIGSASGSTPAYSDGVVFVATAGPGGLGAGRVMAFDAGEAEEPEPLWTFENVKAAGFFGGVCIAEGFVYAASYSYSGGRNSANLVKVNAATGALAWSVGCNRTDSIPVVAEDGRIVVSGGISGFGSLPTVQVFGDLGGSAEMAWDSASATWFDDDGDGAIDAGEYTRMGGWTHQPAVSVGDWKLLLVGAIPAGGEQYAPCTDLYAIDLDAPAGGPGWLVGHFEGAGSTPASADGVVYTVGAEGLFAFGCRADCDGSGTVDLFDFLCFQNAFVGGERYGDCDGNGARDLFDFLCFQNAFATGCG